MIHIVKTLANLPIDDIVGQIVLKSAASDPEWPAYKYPCRVVSVNKEHSQVSLRRLTANFLRGTWVFNDKEADEEIVWDLADVKIVCSTVHEAQEIVDKSKQTLQDYYRIRDRYDADFMKLGGISQKWEPAIIMQARA